MRRSTWWVVEQTTGGVPARLPPPPRAHGWSRFRHCLPLQHCCDAAMLACGTLAHADGVSCPPARLSQRYDESQEPVCLLLWQPACLASWLAGWLGMRCWSVLNPAACLLWVPPHLPLLPPPPSSSSSPVPSLQEIAELTVRKEQLQQQAEATVAKRESLLAQIAALKEVRTALPGLPACLPAHLPACPLVFTARVHSLRLQLSTQTCWQYCRWCVARLMLCALPALCLPACLPADIFLPVHPAPLRCPPLRLPAARMPRWPP